MSQDEIMMIPRQDTLREEDSGWETELGNSQHALDHNVMRHQQKFQKHIRPCKASRSGGCLVFGGSYYARDGKIVTNSVNRRQIFTRTA